MASTSQRPSLREVERAAIAATESPSGETWQVTTAFLALFSNGISTIFSPASKMPRLPFFVLGCLPLLDLFDHLQHLRALGDGGVQLKRKLGHLPHYEAAGQFVAKEASSPAQG